MAAWPVTGWLVSYLVPAIADLSDKMDSASDVPAKRWLVASASMVTMVLLSCFAALASRGVRRQALLVWLCFPRRMILQYLAIAAIGVAGLWCMVFSSATFLLSLGRLAAFVVIAFLLVTIVFGHLAAIVGLGAWRDAAKGLRRLRTRPR